MSSASVNRASAGKIWAVPNLVKPCSQAVDWIWRRNRSFIVLAAELGSAAGLFALAVFALSETRGELWPRQVFSATLGLLLICRFAGLWSVRLYSRTLCSASIPDFISIVNVATITTLAFWALVARLFSQLKMPAALFLLDWALVLLLWGALHFGTRVVGAKQMGMGRKTGKGVIVVGAGDAGVTLLKDLAQGRGGSCRVLALVDDNPEKWGRSVCGVPVVGEQSEGSSANRGRK